jgi:cell division protein FtsI/penicillin-binding protein 2
VLDPESAGSYRTPASTGWSPSDLARQSFGQSILVTPLQIADVYQTIANGGTMMQPYLVSSINNNGHVTTTKPQVKRQVIRASTAKTLTGMLESVAGAEDISVPHYSIAIKTGTSTIQGEPDIDTDASVVGYLPASNPQFVILVKLDRPTASIYGGTVAGPLWASIAQQLMWHYNVPPDEAN